MGPETDTSADENRYGAIETGDGGVVIYDRANEEAWLQSDRPVELAN